MARGERGSPAEGDHCGVHLPNKMLSVLSGPASCFCAPELHKSTHNNNNRGADIETVDFVKNFPQV